MAPEEQATARGGRYVDAGALRTYYEVHGEGDPLILMHGGMCPAETFDALTPGLATTYQVFVPERRAHGRTHDVQGPITYEIMAQDTIAFMDALGIESAHLVGWSDGALVALIVAMRRPERARKLVYIGQNLNLEMVRPEAMPMLTSMTRETAPPFFEGMYAALSPDGPEHYGVVFDKVMHMWLHGPYVELSEIKGVSAPTLVLIGDDDLISAEQAAEMQRTLPNAQLAVVPGTSHALPMEKPDLLGRLILDFLADQQVPKMMPLGDHSAEAGH